MRWSTDNAKCMGKIRQILHQDDTNLNIYGNFCQWLNLLGNSKTSSTERTHVEVNKYFQNDQQPVVWQKDYTDSAIPQPPRGTGWKSELNCLETETWNQARLDYEKTRKGHWSCHHYQDHWLHSVLSITRFNWPLITHRLYYRHLPSRPNTGLALTNNTWLDILISDQF